MGLPITEKVRRGVFYFCSTCGAKVPEDSQVCPDCGLAFGGTRYDNPADMPPDEVKLRRTQRRFAYVLLAALLIGLAALVILRPACIR